MKGKNEASSLHLRLLHCTKHLSCTYASPLNDVVRERMWQLIKVGAKSEFIHFISLLLLLTDAWNAINLDSWHSGMQTATNASRCQSKSCFTLARTRCQKRSESGCMLRFFLNQQQQHCRSSHILWCKSLSGGEFHLKIACQECSKICWALEILILHLWERTFNFKHSWRGFKRIKLEILSLRFLNLTSSHRRSEQQWKEIENTIENVINKLHSKLSRLIAYYLSCCTRTERRVIIYVRRDADDVGKSWNLVSTNDRLREKRRAERESQTGILLSQRVLDSFNFKFFLFSGCQVHSRVSVSTTRLLLIDHRRSENLSKWDPTRAVVDPIGKKSKVIF